ncbi:MAG TPA: Calx-beta domain-containing protein, partial [Pyrinomonadaceae bacterium]|nr:Calx-beta domain-containing protein [Pyrinomonadaceae bacterium]
AYITGTTASSDFPTRNPIQASGGNTAGDVFVTKLNSQGSDFVYSTYLGGTGFDAGRGIAVDSANNAYVAGLSDSPEFPLIAGALRTRSPMYKSVDGAANWGNDNYGFTATAITSLAIHPLQPSTIYAGTTTGIFKTTNGGRTWSPMNNGLDNRNVTAIVIDPSATSIVYAATSGLSNFGVYKSTDGGATWNRRSNGITSIQTIGLAIDPVTPNTLYAVFNNGSNGGIYKTTDGADNWVVVGNQPPFWPGTLVIDPLNHTTLYATDANNTGGVFKSTDAGLTWQGAGLNQTGPFGRSVAVSPLTPGLVYADTGQGLFKSVDGGSNWTLIPSRSGKIVFDPVSSSTVYLLSPQFSNTPGLFKSTDNGQTWKAVNKGLNTPQALVLVIDPLNPSNLYLASQPSGGSDAFVTKFNPAGSALIYSTFLGGPTAENLSGVTAQAFAIALDNGSNAYVTGITSAAAFPVTNNSYQPFIRGGNDAFISKLTMSYIIGGQVLNNGASPLNGVEVILNDGVSLSSVMTENDGTYQFSHLREGGSFTVSASKPHFTVTPASQTFNNLNSDQVLNFTAITSDSPFFTISGQVTENGVPLAGVTVTLSGSQSGIRTTDSNGNYSFEVIIAGNYTVTPSMLGFNFGPASQTFNALTTNQTANFPATRQSFVVTNANNHGTGSLREAIVNANATLGTDTITFNIPGPGVKTISLLTALPEITERVVIDGTTQPGYAGTPLIELDGFATNSSTGLVIKAGGSTVRGLSLGNFRGNGAIWLTGCDNNVIQANYVGIAADGTTARPNSSGIVLNNSSNNIIGGTTAASRNVISGNLFNGVELNGNTNVVQGNFIGTNAAGTAAIANTNGVGVISSQYTDNLIGGTAAGARNLISGNQTGVVANGTGTTIQGNLIGTDATGTNKVPNNNGVRAQGLNILVGGLTPGARNVISGNLGNGVDTRGAGNKVQGNFIGTDITGTLALGNDSHGVVAGDNALIGGTVPEARNIISGNGSMGSGANVALGDNNAGSAAMVQGNYIGTDVTGMSSLHNPLLGVIAGISISSSNNIIGGVTAGARNVISGNDIGIQVGSSFTGGAFGNVIQGNFIGLNAAGTGPLPNMQQGIAITDGVNNTIGSTQSQAGNKIAFNNGPGVTVTAGSGATGNAIRGNSIFSNNGLGIDLGTIGVTANDGNDTDTGANNLQNFPVITTVLSSANSTTIQGSLKSIPLTTFQLDFYSNAAVDPSGNGEGAQFFNTTPVTTDANGDATINVTFPAGLPSGRVITATATDPNGNTSEFSAADSTSAAGSVQFRTSSIAVIEDIGVLTVNVLRTGGAAGSISVDYATSDGTAIAGQDYTAASGTLNFNSGETLKTFQIPIADDGTTEPDETFTVTLRNASSLEALGAPSIMNVTIQDRTTTPLIFITDAAVVEGNTGSETDLVFTVALSAATGKTVSGNYSMLSFSAFGGNKCDNAVGIDYINTNGSFSFQPGTTEFSIPVKVCGDPFAEANETFRVLISNVSNATLLQNQAIGTIINDDVLGMLLEESGPSANQAVAIDAVLGIRDPFRWLMPDWYSSVPQNTRVMLFAQNLQLNPNEVSSAVIVRLTASNNQTFDIPAEDVRALRESEFTQVVFRLPTSLPAGNCTVVIRAHSRTSNSGTIRIVP